MSKQFDVLWRPAKKFGSGGESNLRPQVSTFDRYFEYQRHALFRSNENLDSQIDPVESESVEFETYKSNDKKIDL